MDVRRTLSISEARKRIFEIANEVQKSGTHYTLTENGRPKAVIMSAEEFESWQETLEVMRNFPNLQKDIDEVERDLASSAYKNYATLEEILAQEGYIVADKAEAHYAISRRAQGGRAKSALRPAAKKKR